MARTTKRGSLGGRARTTAERIRKQEIQDLPSAASGAGLPHVTVRRSGYQSFFSGGYQSVEYDTVVADTAAFADLGSWPDRLTAPVDGRYMGIFEGWWTNLAAANVSIRALFDLGAASGGTVLDYDTGWRSGAPTELPAGLTPVVLPMSAGDYLRVRVYQNTGSNARLGIGAGIEANLGPVFSLIQLS